MWIVVDSCLLVVDELVIDEQVLPILREGHEVHTDSEGIGIRVIRLLYGWTLDVVVLDEEVLVLGGSELLGFV